MNKFGEWNVKKLEYYSISYRVYKKPFESSITICCCIQPYHIISLLN